MAATTISAILARIETVLAATPLNLLPSGDPFSPMGVSGAVVDSTFRVVHGGQVSNVPQTNFASARLDRIVVTVMRQISSDGYRAQRELQDQLDAVERAVIADGPDHDYMVTSEKGSRKVTRLKDSDVLEGAIAFLVDFDFNEAA